MSIPFERIIPALKTHLLACGQFDQVNDEEPKSAPTGQRTAAIWPQSVVPTRGSGLNRTDATVVFMIRIYLPMIANAPDAIELSALRTIDDVMGRLSADIELREGDGTAVDAEPIIRTIDLLGQTGVPMGAQAGYVEIDRKMFRIMDVTVPIICNDAWDQER